MKEPVLKSLLVANRGEIALRIAATCQRLGITPFFVYESADQGLPHAKTKNSYNIQSYTDPEELIAVAKKLGVEGIHPGYGFISELPLFPKLTEEAGIEFIGPSSAAMARFGNKQEMLKGVSFIHLPRIPGVFVNIDDTDAILDAADELHYPVIAKGKESAGGRHIKVNHSKEDLLANITDLRQGDIAEVYISKFMTNVKHIEVQLLGDKRGRIVSL